MLWIVSNFARHKRFTYFVPLGVESAAFPGQSEEETERLLHIVCSCPGGSFDIGD